MPSLRELLKVHTEGATLKELQVYLGGIPETTLTDRLLALHEQGLVTRFPNPMNTHEYLWAIKQLTPSHTIHQPRPSRGHHR